MSNLVEKQLIKNILAKKPPVENIRLAKVRLDIMNICISEGWSSLGKNGDFSFYCPQISLLFLAQIFSISRDSVRKGSTSKPPFLSSN
jgi:hypothetical protein